MRYGKGLCRVEGRPTHRQKGHEADSWPLRLLRLAALWSAGERLLTVFRGSGPEGAPIKFCVIQTELLGLCALRFLASNRMRKKPPLTLFGWTGLDLCLWHVCGRVSVRNACGQLPDAGQQRPSLAPKTDRPSVRMAAWALPSGPMGPQQSENYVTERVLAGSVPATGEARFRLAIFGPRSRVLCPARCPQVWPGRTSASR